MTVSNEFTPWDFLQLAKEAAQIAREAAEHKADLKIRLAEAGVGRRGDRG